MMSPTHQPVRADPDGLRLFGVPVRVQGSFLLVALLLGWSLGPDLPLLVTWLVVVTVSVLWHELGHAVAFRAFGHAPAVVLHGLGGATSSRGGPPLGAGPQLLISLAGPAAGLALGAAVLAGLELVGPLQDRLLRAAGTFLIWTNIGWGVLNLLPVLPLDGGRVLESGLSLLTRGRGRVAAQVVSVAVAGVGGAVAMVAGWWWTALLAAWFGAMNVAGLWQRHQAADRQAEQARLADGYHRLGQGDLEAAAATADGLRDGTSDRQVRAGSALLLAWTRLLRDRPAEAGEILAETYDPGLPVAVLPEEVVRAAGGTDLAVRLLRGAYEARPGEATAVPLALALVQAGRPEEITGLLEREAAGMAAYAAVGRALVQAGHFEQAARAGARGFERHGDPALAYSTAVSWARAGRHGEALRWLERAATTGFADLERLRSDQHLAAVRSDPAYPPLEARVAARRRDDTRAGDRDGTGTLAPGVCYRHPRTAGRRSCPRCGRPVCARCTIPTTAGPLCPSCASQPTGEGRRPLSLGVLVLLGTIVLVFLLQQARPELTRSFAAFPPAIAAGDWWLLLTPMLLHAGLAHVAFNGYALWLFGREAELVFGTLRFAALFAVSGFAGSAAHYAFGPCLGLSVGASGAVFGVLGAMAWSLFIRRDVPGARQQLRGIGVLIALNLALGFAVPNIANLAHLGGLVAGAALGAGFDRFRRPVPGPVQLGVVLVVVAAGWGLVVWRTNGFVAQCAGELVGRGLG